MKARIVSQVREAKYDLASQIPVPSPFVIYIEPSGLCNNFCSFCPQSVDDPAFKKSIMSMDTWCKAMDDMTKFPARTKVLRVCGNGEPLLNPELGDMLEYADFGYVAERVELITNGTLLDEVQSVALPLLCDRIIVSVYDHDISEKVALLHEHSGNCIIHVKGMAELTTPEQFYGTYGDICDEIYIENRVPMWPQFDLPAPEEFRYGGKPTKRRVCSQIFKGMQVQAEGEVVPCCVDWRRVNVIGDIHNESLMDIWRGEKLERLRSRHLAGLKSSTPPCDQCRMNDYCDVDDIDKTLEGK